ncbi:MAG: BadF/BadG/BcrA/BcrD ATPase family protein [Acidobacteriaceae bacterium]
MHTLLSMYFLGIDAGGSKTALALGDEANLYAQSQTGSIKLGRVTEAQAMDCLRSGVRGTCEVAAIAEEEIARCCIGFSGVSRPELVAVVHNLARQVLPNAQLRIIGDHVVAHRAAFPDGVGVIVIAGTGSVCYGRNVRGIEARAGGHGPVVSDEGSASWIGREAVRRVLRAHDRRQTLPLLQAIVDYWELKDIKALVGHANRIAAAEFAALYPAVSRAAELADELALALLRDAATELAQLAEIVAQRIGIEEIALAGGTADASARLRREFATAVKLLIPHANIRSGSVNPAEGALRIARESYTG